MDINNNVREDRRLTESETRDDLIRRFAFNFYQIRQRCRIQGTPEEDWQDGVEAYESYCNLNDMLDRREV